MASDQPFQSPDVPSKRKLAVASAAAFLGAAIVFVTAVLPVEYNVDPLGTGKALGLLRVSPVEEVLPSIEGAAALEPVQQGAVALYADGYKVDTVEFVLDPYEYLEYKYHLAQGAGMVFAWSADAPLIHEFHGDPDADPNDVRSYDKSVKRSANGSFVAPVSGIHGWYWENPGAERIVVKLSSAGFYAYGLEIHSDKTRHRHELSGVGGLAVAP